MREDVGFQKREGKIVAQTEGESTFKRPAPIEANDREYAVAVLVWETKRSSLLEERNGWWEEVECGCLGKTTLSLRIRVRMK